MRIDTVNPSVYAQLRRLHGLNDRADTVAAQVNIIEVDYEQIIREKLAADMRILVNDILRDPTSVDILRLSAELLLKLEDCMAEKGRNSMSHDDDNLQLESPLTDRMNHLQTASSEPLVNNVDLSLIWELSRVLTQNIHNITVSILDEDSEFQPGPNGIAA
ncbi:MAG: hypothetical protein JWM56_62 [Candidatus Peribacteria bacterium]|nr:hypothetical protein [Candidatus Peribacteria bacterium]